MDAFERIEQELHDEGITVFRDKLPKCQGFITSFYDFIYLNVDRDLRGAKALSVLTHETGHYRTGFTGDCRRTEHRADLWAAGRLLPPPRLIHALQGGCRNTYELSRELGIDEEYMKRCLALLAEKYGAFYESGDHLLTFSPLAVRSRSTGQVWPDAP